MYPIGTYERFKSEINKREGEKRASLIGVLFADIRQSETKEYILNYMDSFNSSSGKFIDFYIPGYYKEESATKGNENIHGFEEIEINSKRFKFSNLEYDKAVISFTKEFKLKRRYVPVLYLVEWANGDYSTAKIIEIELDKGEHSVRKSGELFDFIFKIAENGQWGFGKTKAESIANKLTVNDLAGYLSNEFASDTGIPLLATVVNIGTRVRNFKL